MKITFEGVGRLVRFQSLDIGECYTSANPQSDQVYMKASSNRFPYPGAVSLKSGVHYEVSPDKMVNPVECELIVRKQ